MPADWKQPGVAWRSVQSGRRLDRPAPLFGEHTRSVLRALLGYDEAQLEELHAAAVIGDEPINPGVG